MPMRANVILAFLLASLCGLVNAAPTLLKPARVSTGNANEPVRGDWVVLLMAKESALPDRQAREGSGSGFRVSSFEFRVLAALVSKV
jgi:hypothetical protein